MDQTIESISTFLEESTPVAVPAICIVGLFGNFLNIIILIRPALRTHFYVLLIGLTFCDALFLLCNLIKTQIGPYSSDEGIDKRVIFVEYFAITGQCGSIYFTLLVTLERYMMTYWPSRTKALVTTSKAKCLVIFVILMCFILNLPAIVPVSTFLQEMANPIYGQYMTRYQPLFLFVIPFLLLFIFNIVTCVKVQTTSTHAQDQTNQEESSPEHEHAHAFPTPMELSNTKLFLRIVLAFGICYAPLVLGTGTLAIYMANNESPRILLQVVLTFYQLGSMTYNLNSGIKFIIYCAFGKYFRAEIRRSTCSRIKMSKKGRIRAISAVENVDQMSSV